MVGPQCALRQKIVTQKCNNKYARVFSLHASTECCRDSEKMNIEQYRQEREALPIFNKKEEFLSLLANNQIIVVVGETGSGKTTQIPQYLAEANFSSTGCIGCTQPRRVAASSVASRVSAEFGCDIGSEVGYSIRFENVTTDRTIIKYMTDGILLHECLREPDLNDYSVIILDEAHERTINTDVLFGLLKRTASKRKDLKIIVASATLDQQQFSTFFNDAPALHIPGRRFDVDILYTGSTLSNYMTAAERKIIEIHTLEKPGDILVFLTGQEEIETLCETLEDKVLECGSLVGKLIVYPLYSGLDGSQQEKVFEKTTPGARKVVVATNIAESSLTIDGIVYVVDSGYVKQRVHRPKSGIDDLEVKLISQAQAVQRAGRAGRTAPGKCYRLYRQEDFDKMPPLFVPEIQRSNLSSVVLQLKAMGIENVASFQFMDPPPAEAMIAAIYHLLLLGAITEDETITTLGAKMSEFPLDPCLAKYLVLSAEMGCSDEVLTIISLLSVQNIQKLFRRPKRTKDEADRRHKAFSQSDGDHVTLLNIYGAWQENRHSESWCWSNFLSIDVLRRAQEIRGQLLRVMDRVGLPIISCNGEYQRIREAICATFFYNFAQRKAKFGYKVLRDGEEVYLRPGSALFSELPVYIVFKEVLRTRKCYISQATPINPMWLAQYAPEFFHFFFGIQIQVKSRFNDLRLATERRVMQHLQ